tara:strand:+ start:532 stop:819 length:288 start_codon:yes stop_codon:yes gene_type:complete
LLDYESANTQLLQMKQMHCDVCEYLEEIDSDFHENAAKTLASRIKIILIKPIEKALRIIEAIELIGRENLPRDISLRWNQEISKALSFGGVKIDF